MMDVVHLATSVDDLYTGFDDLKISQTMQRSSAEGASRRGRLDTLFSRAGPRLVTSTAPAPDQARPMTAIRAVGYSSYGNRGFDPLNLSLNVHGKQSVLENNEETAEEKIRQLEKKINELIEESCVCASKKDTKLALEKAKEASQKERICVRQREQFGLGENLDLTFIVLFNLASQYTLNELYSEALNTYQVLMRNRSFSNAGRLKVNMGNIYVKLGQYSKAIKLYRMALDQVPNTQKRMRIKIMQNIGVLFVKMGKYGDAITSFEYIMGEYADFKTGLNLVLCYFALNDKEKMKNSFQKLVNISLKNSREEDDCSKHASTSDGPLRDAIASDSLMNIEIRKKHEAEWSILMACKLISPVVDKDLNQGFSWCTDVVKASTFLELVHELEINKAVLFLKQKEFSAAIETLKSFERKKNAKVASIAATNLSFLYLLEKDLTQADQYADIALSSDHYNSGALVNKGCCIYLQGDFHKAQDYFKEALVNEATCVEALYDLGLSLQKTGHYEDALECFSKLQAMLPNQPPVIYQLATTCDLLKENDLAMEWYMQLLNLVPTDAGLLHKMGITFEAQGDRQQAFQYHYDSYRNYPSDTQVSTWLGAYFIDSEVYEKAVTYFERATIMQPSEVKWQLMVASCHRRSGNYQKALAVYKGIHRKFPDNVECLKFIVRLCSDMGLQEADRYTALLAKAEQACANRERQGGSGRSRSGRQSSENSSSKSNIASVEDYRLKGVGSSQSSVPYVDTLQPRSERPRTSVRNRNVVNDDGFSDDDELGDLLP